MELARERRSRLQIYYDILSAVQLDVDSDHIGPTRVGQIAGLSYDKLVRHLSDLNKTGLLSMKDRMLAVTERGREFLKSYDRLVNVMSTMAMN